MRRWSNRQTSAYPSSFACLWTDAHFCGNGNLTHESEVDGGGRTDRAVVWVMVVVLWLIDLNVYILGDSQISLAAH